MSWIFSLRQTWGGEYVSISSLRRRRMLRAVCRTMVPRTRRLTTIPSTSGPPIGDLMVDLIWMRYRPLLRWWMKITTVSLSNKLRVESLQQMSNSINRSSTGNCAWSSNRSSHATTTFVSDEVLWVLNLDSGRLSKDKECPRVDMVRCWNSYPGPSDTFRENLLLTSNWLPPPLLIVSRLPVLPDRVLFLGAYPRSSQLSACEAIWRKRW